MADRQVVRPFQGIFIIMFLIGMGIFIYGGSRFNTDIVLGGFGVCVASIFIPIIIGVFASCCKGSTQRNVPVHQGTTIYGTSYPSSVTPNQYSGVAQGQYPNSQYPGGGIHQFPGQHPGVPSQYPGASSLSPGVAPTQYPSVPSQYSGGVSSQYPGVTSQYPGVPSQYPGVASQYPQAVPSQYPGAVLGQYPVVVPSQYSSVVPPQTLAEAQAKPSAPQDPEFLARVPPPSYNEAMNLARN